MIYYNIETIRKYNGDHPYIVRGITAAYILGLTYDIPKPYQFESEYFPDMLDIADIRHVDKLDYTHTKVVNGMYVRDELRCLIDMINDNVSINAICESLETLTTCEPYNWSWEYIEENILPYLVTNKFPWSYYKEVSDGED